ncbi:BREX-1 system adenine-specific DNA-methyltransferase PglX [bacterium]|nr:MAG: BREX-1 system adenine-specific DNA-methyltransferase PglX [bacterium]
MNKNKLKTYAPKAREEFIKAVTERAHFYGIAKDSVEPCTIKGDFAFIAGRPFPKKLADTRKILIDRLEKSSFTQVMEEVAYTWFNRIAAIRFMEINGYLSHGYRVLSHPDGHAEPEILEKAQFIDKLDGLEKEEILRLKMAADKDKELYQRLLVAQCNELSNAMPFLFEKVDDPTELLLPDNLLNTDSVVRQMVNEIPEEDWKEVEIIGWLYQFYISEKKDALMKAKKAYKTEDIPAVTQLFTPNWIVKYLVQNSLGAKWLVTYPASGIKEKMEYYITPAEQSEDVKAKLKEITPTSLNPEELTILDPACGSGHILVEAHDLLKEIYLERGYRAKDIPGLILTKNLYGLEIDDRAAQLSGFALMMKARQDDREIFKKNIRPNIVSLKSANYSGSFKEAKELVELFENAKTFGSLIRVSEEIVLKLPDIKRKVQEKRNDLNSHLLGEGVDYYDNLLALVQQAELLSKRYDCVIANPPYMGGKGMNGTLKEFAKTQYPSTKSDLFAIFIERGFELAKDSTGYNAMVTMQSWMFLSSFEKCRELWIDTKTIQSMVHLGARAFSTISGEVVTVTAFSFINVHLGKYKPSFLRLVDGDDEDKRQGILNKSNLFNQTIQDDFKKIPGSPIAYWVSDKLFNIFEKSKNLGEECPTKQGIATGDNGRFVRFWHEVGVAKIGFGISKLDDAATSIFKWFPYSKGGSARKWYGNLELIVDWSDNGRDIRENVDENNNLLSRPQNLPFQFLEAATWSLTSSANIAFCARWRPHGCMFDVNGMSAFPSKRITTQQLVAIMNTKVAQESLRFINPTLAFQSGDIASIPLPPEQVLTVGVTQSSSNLIDISKHDWDSYETSWDFAELPILRSKNKRNAVSESYQGYRKECRKMTDQMKQLEEENNRIFIEAYSLQNELAPEVPIEDITLFANPEYRYRGELTDDELESRFQADTMKELLSYAVGCMMGRYSLDITGLIYAHAENKGFDPKKCKTFPADEDGIIPITEREWFNDDAACRFFRFIAVVWDKKRLDENLDFIADAIGRKAGESSREAIRRYLANDFYKDHVQTYKNRPIYWLFSSGKEKSFQALVYLHRYNEGTLARMRTEYVLPLQTKISRQIEHLEKDKDAAQSGSEANKIQKEILSLRKQAEELGKFDELLRHYADKKIKLDLDDGVKVNYRKFGDLLSDVKKIAGSDDNEQREDTE